MKTSEEKLNRNSQQTRLEFYLDLPLVLVFRELKENQLKKFQKLEDRLARVDIELVYEDFPYSILLYTKSDDSKDPTQISSIHIIEMRFKMDEPERKRKERLSKLSNIICEYYKGNYKLEGFYDDISVEPPKPYNLALLSQDLKELYRPNFKDISIGLHIISTRIKELVNLQLPRKNLADLGAYNMVYHLMGDLRPEESPPWVWKPEDKSFTVQIRFKEQNCGKEELIKALSMLLKDLKQQEPS